MTKPDSEVFSEHEYATLNFDRVEDKISALEKLIEEKGVRYDERMRSQEREVSAALASQDKYNAIVAASAKEAIMKAESAQNSYNRTHNDLLNKNDELTKTFIAKAEYKASHDNLVERVDREVKSLEERLSRMSEELKAFDIKFAVMEGKASQKSVTFALVFSSIGAIGTTVGLIVAILKLLGL